MSQGVEVAGLYVRDQDEAVQFYVEKLGFRVHTDVRNGGYRWLTVQHPDQPSFQLGLFAPQPLRSTRLRHRLSARSSRKAPCRRWCWSSTTAGPPTTGCAPGESSSYRIPLTA